MKKFALFILSHNRANKISALDALEKSNYDGMWYVVISTDNNQMEQYKKIVPHTHLLIFDKHKIECDTMLSRARFKLNAAIYARNFIIDYAKDKFTHFCMMDDDISKIFFRVNVDGHMKKLDATKYIGDICQEICTFLDSSRHLGGLGLKNDNGYFGGVLALDKINREIQQFMVLKSNDVRRFNGLVYEDAILSCNNFDKVYFEFPGISVLSPQEGKNIGGVSYDRKMLHPSLFWHIACPNALKIVGLDGKRKRTNKYMYPQIINKKYKKL